MHWIKAGWGGRITLMVYDSDAKPLSKLGDDIMRGMECPPISHLTMNTYEHNHLNCWLSLI